MAKKQNKSTATGSTSSGQAERVGIFGASGCGKTTKARELTAGLNRIVYFDPLQEIAREKGIKPFRNFLQLKKALLDNFKRGFRFAFCPDFGSEIQQLNDLSYFLIELQRGYGSQHTAKITLVVDELDVSFPSGILQKDRRNGFAFLSCRGRHSGINIIGISQRMPLVDITFRANCSALYIFRHTEPADIEVASRLLGREYKETFKKLNNYEYFYKQGSKIFLKS